MGALNALDPLGRISCTLLVAPNPPPEVQVPFLGALKKARESLYGLPDPSALLMKFMDNLNLAMAPLRQFLKLVQTIMAIKDCVTAIPEAILTLSPAPIIKCLKNLMKYIAKLIAMIPPMSYVRLLVDICSVIIQLVDELIYTVQVLDARIQQYFADLATATALGDTKLIEFTNCGASELQIIAINMSDILKLIKPVISLILDPLVDLMPSGDLKNAVKALENVDSALGPIAATVQSAGASVAALQVALRPLVMLLGPLREVIVTTHNTIAPLIGRDPLATREVPEFTSF